jgi:hypothetical protein
LGGFSAAEADEVEGEVGYRTGGNVTQVDGDGDRAVGVAGGGDAGGFVFVSIGLQVEDGVGFAQAHAA